MAKGFEINKRGIRQYTKALEREFKKHPVRVPIEISDDPSLPAVPGAVVNQFNGDIVNSQMALNSQGARLVQNNSVVQLPEEYLQIAELLRRLPAELPDEQRMSLEVFREDVLAEVESAQPDRTKTDRALVAMRGMLAPIAAGAVAGTAEGVQAWAADLLGLLASALS